MTEKNYHIEIWKFFIDFCDFVKISPNFFNKHFATLSFDNQNELINQFFLRR